VLGADVSLKPVAEPEFAVVRELAGTIWRQHYSRKSLQSASLDLTGF
jgi:hypothetical protein